MDQDETWHTGRPRPWPHCVRWGPSSPFPKGRSPQFSAHICCGQMARLIKLLLGMEVGLSPGHIVLDGNPAPHPKRGHRASPFSAHVCCGQTVGMVQDASWYEGMLGPDNIVFDADHLHLPPKGQSPPPIFGPCLLWPNGWIDQGATWYEGRPRPRPHCVTWDGASPIRDTTPNVYCGQTIAHLSYC